MTCICKFRELEWAGLGWRVDRVYRRQRDPNVVLMVEQVNHAIGKSRSTVWRLGEFSKVEGVINEPEEVHKACGFGVRLGV